MQDLPLILKAWEACRGAGSGEEAVLATVIEAQGSAFRHPGAKMLIHPDRGAVGSVSGPCIEKMVRARAWFWTERGAAVVSLANDREDDPPVARTGCGGGISLLVERVSARAPGPLEFLRSAASHRTPAVFGTVIATGERTDCKVGERIFYAPCPEVKGLMPRQRYGIIDGAGGSQLFFEAVAPPRRVLIVGTGRDAEELAALAQRLSWEVIVVDARCDPGTRHRFATADCVFLGALAGCPDAADLTGTAVIVMSHSLAIDASALAYLANSGDAAYIGVMGPRARTEKILHGLAGDRPANLHYPAGLDIGSETEQEIALSIAAAIQAAYNGRAYSLHSSIETNQEIAV